MPATPAANTKLQRALAAVDAALRPTGVPWMVIGGIAVIARGVRRMTTDIDITVPGDAATVDALLRMLCGEAIVPRIANAAAFARDNLVLLVRHEPTRVELDVALAFTPFEHEALAGRTETPFGSVTVPMARAEDLVLYKALAGRPKDIEDATTLLLLYPEIDIARVRKHVADMAEAADDPTLTAALTDILKSAKRER